MKKHKEIFSQIYDNEEWGFGKGSGMGSSKLYCKKYIIFLEKFIKENNIENVLDFGCGDWQFSQYVDWKNINYIGIDVVECVIKNNKQNFAKQNISFVNDNNILKYINKKNQLILIKDVLQHWTNEAIIIFMDNLLCYLTSKNKCILITNSWKYEGPRISIDNPQNYAPLDSQKWPLIKYKPEVVFHWRSKQVSLIR